MRKHKSVVAILLAVMMVFTFMPTMAFADAPADTKAKVTFSSNYEKVTVPAYTDTESAGMQVPQHTYDTVRYYDNVTGAIYVTIDKEKAEASVSWTIPNVWARYYDLNVAEFADANDKTLKAEYAFGAYTKGSMTKIKLNVPSYVANKTEAKTVGTTIEFPVAAAQFRKLASGGANSLKGNWDGKAVGDEKFDATARTEQTFTLSLDGDYKTPDAADAIKLYGTIPAKEVKVNAATPDPAEDAKYFFDSEDGLTFTDNTGILPLVRTMYDGSEHTFVASAVEGWTASYSVYNKKTGTYDAGAVKLSEIQAEPVKVRVEWTKNGETAPTTDETREFYVNLMHAGNAEVGFVVAEDIADGFHHVAGSTYNAADYIDAVALAYYDSDNSNPNKATEKLIDAATAKAVAANKAELINYLNDMYDVVAAVSVYNPNFVTLTLVEKDMTATEIKAFEAKYKSLTDKFAKIIVDRGTQVALNGVDPTDFEIEFTKAPAKVTYKTKKSKLTKTKTFSVAAECKNGTVLKYKLINAPKKSISINSKTGKITVKKGLKTGTYTFKVKAYISSGVVGKLPGAMKIKDYSEIQTVKVVVKKSK